MDQKAKTLDLDGALEEIARKARPNAAVYTISPSRCETYNCSPQCDCCSGEYETQVGSETCTSETAAC